MIIFAVLLDAHSFVVLGIYTKALSYELHFDTFDVLNESRDGRKYLLHNVPVVIKL